jgi:hypothetical protein
VEFGGGGKMYMKIKGAIYGWERGRMIREGNR